MDDETFHVVFVLVNTGRTYQHGPFHWNTAVMEANDLRVNAWASNVEVVPSIELELR